jgi:uncharacterized protein YndB with AHSA1/START domain
MSSTVQIEPVRQAITVACPVEDAWRVFTAETSSWWPLATHSIYQGRAKEVAIEPRADGEMRETSVDGETAHWARVLAWEPPHRLVLAWRVDPGAPAPTEIEVRFSAVEGGTRVDLEHRGWERLGDAGQESRDNYDRGWPRVLGRLADRVAAG